MEKKNACWCNEGRQRGMRAPLVFKPVNWSPHQSEGDTSVLESFAPSRSLLYHASIPVGIDLCMLM